MKIAIIGATGMSGSRIRDEALKRGHMVKGISRHTDKLPKHDNLTPVNVDANDVAALTEAIKGSDVVICAVHFHEANADNIFEAITRAGIKKVAVVGGAASLELAPGMLVRHADFFQPEWAPSADAQMEVLDMLKKNDGLEWIYLSPAGYFFDGDAKGQFRYGKDKLIIDDEGHSAISTGDYAVAMLDEIENPKHVRERFTVGY